MTKAHKTTLCSKPLQMLGVGRNFVCEYCPDNMSVQNSLQSTTGYITPGQANISEDDKSAYKILARDPQKQ